MGRVIRRVPPHWEHPKNLIGKYIPMYNINYHEAALEWIKNFKRFEAHPLEFSQHCTYYWEYDTPPLNEESYVPYSQEEATWFQVYETVSEGTPVTPPFETQDELIQHLIEFGESLNPHNNDKISRESAEDFVLNKGWVPSMVVHISTDGPMVRNGINICGDDNELREETQTPSRTTGSEGSGLL